MLELTIVIVVAAALGAFLRMIRQPVILAYLAAGIVVGWFGFFHFGDQETFRLFSDLGIMFLLFLVGLEINYASLRHVGRASVIVGIGQIVFTFGFGYLIGLFFGFPPLESVYISIALTFSSTIIVVKLLSEKRDLNSLYGKISIGFLLLQDFIAILILILLAGLGEGGELSIGKVILTTLIGIILFVVMVGLGRNALPIVFDRVARSQELLFLVSLAWLFLLATISKTIGFSIEIAGFLAGIALANSSEHYQIANRMRPLRDFFMLVFFVILGSSFALTDFSGLTLPILAFSLFVLIGNPLIVLVIMGIMGYRKRTSFLAGVTVAQISEFSLVLAALGHKVGHITTPVVSLITAVGIITITISSYFILYSDKMYRRVERALSLFERKRLSEDGETDEGFRKPVVLIGCHRTGQSIAFTLRKEDVLVIDFDPDVVQELRRLGFVCLFGDITDPEIFERANIRTARLVISTSPDLEDNLMLLEELSGEEVRPKAVVRAETEKEAQILYGKGADYVLLPNVTAGQYLGKTIAVDPGMEILENLKKRDLALLKSTEDVFK